MADPNIKSSKKIDSHNSERLNNFDLLRLFAALQVVCFHGIEHLKIAHLVPELMKIIINAFPGVPIFFFISGFLISTSFERSTTLSSYTKKRFLRIFPGLWVCFIFTVVSVLVVAPQFLFAASYKDLFIWIATQLSFVQFYNPDFLRAYGVGAINGSLWTIAVELQFYIVLPLVYVLLPASKSKRRLILLGLTLVFLAINQIFNHPELLKHAQSFPYRLLGVSFLPYFWLFLTGVIAQQNFDAIRWYFEGRVGWWLGIHLVAVTATFFAGYNYGSNHPFPLTALSLCGLTLSGAYSYRSLSNRWLKKNDVSYGVYVYHMVIANAMIHLGLTGQLNHWMMLIGLSLLCGYLSWRFVEKPSLARNQ